MTRRYRSLRSLVAKRPPSSGTRGRRSGGSTGITSRMSHCGSLPESRTASMIFRRLAMRFRLASLVASFISARSSAAMRSTSRSASSCLMASAPIFASKMSPYSSTYSMYFCSESTSPCCSGVRPGSVTMYATQYSTFSRSLSVMSSMLPMREGRLFRNQMCATGVARLIWPRRSRRTLD